jgi:hypothetical protein
MFKTDFPEFEDGTVDTDAKINAALSMAPPNFDESVWGDQLRDGLGNWIAFRVTLKNQMARLGAGFASGSSSIEKTVGSEIIKRSQSQSQSTQLAELGIYAANEYGRLYWALMQMVGAGAVVI